MIKKKATELSKKLAQRLKKEFNFDVEPIIQRTYAGYWQRSNGAWLWFMVGKGGDIGSGYRAKEVLRAKKLSSLSDEIFIEEK